MGTTKRLHRRGRLRRSKRPTSARGAAHEGGVPLDEGDIFLGGAGNDQVSYNYGTFNGGAGEDFVITNGAFGVFNQN